MPIAIWVPRTEVWTRPTIGPQRRSAADTAHPPRKTISRQSCITPKSSTLPIQNGYAGARSRVSFLAVAVISSAQWIATV